MFNLPLALPIEYVKTRWLGSVISIVYGGVFTPTSIEINSKLKNSKELERVIKHELIHVYLMRTENYDKHGDNFKVLADKFNVTTISPTGRKLYATMYPQLLEEE
jgi:hypothetical protein